MSEKKERYLVIDQSVLPEVFNKVVLAREYLDSGEAKSTSEAVKKAGISRSVYYKYKDSVFRYINKESRRILTVQVILTDKPGVLMNLLSYFYGANANILTVNQNIPVKNRAFVSISARADRISESADEFIDGLKKVDGVIKIDSILE